MAAAALGNTISDVAGIGSAWYGTFIMNRKLPSFELGSLFTQHKLLNI
jgi:hypothetical protein